MMGWCVRVDVLLSYVAYRKVHVGRLSSYQYYACVVIGVVVGRLYQVG
jgi:hypothetical protein